MSEDRGGMLSHSRVQVWFDSQTFESGRIDKSLLRILPEQFIDLSISYLNKFIRTYKFVTNEYWLRPLIRRDIFSIQYILVDTEGNQESIYEMITAPNVVQFNGGKEFQLPDNDEKFLRTALVADFYDFGKEFLLNLTDNMTLGYYNIALVQAATFFEYFVYSGLRQKLSNTQLDKIRHKKECGCWVGISEVCEKGILEHFRVDFGTTDEFKALQTNALRYRNQIVHGELLESITKEQCEKAIESVRNAQAYLILHVFGDANGVPSTNQENR
jgi:hypothetical protein